MSDVSQGPGWWMASDGKWYPPQSAPGYVAPTGQSVGQVPGMTPNYPNAQNVGYVAVPVDALGRPFAGWHHRVGATLIDSILLFVPAVAIFTASGTGSFSIVLLGVEVVYQALMLGFRGQTLGNMVAGTVVVDVKTGAQLDAGKAWIRSFMEGLIKLGSVFLLIPILLDILWPLWDKQNQTLHDKVAGTVVVKKA